MTAESARQLVFVDVETTGLDPTRHDIWEIAYAWDVPDTPVMSGFVSHRPVTLGPDEIAAARVNRYIDRDGWRAASRAWRPGITEECADTDIELDLMDALEDATLVGANPAFDAAMLRARWGVAPWHHRLLDIEAYAAGAFGWTELRGLAGIAEHLGVAAPDHTAAGDVACLRACWQAIQTELDA